MNFDQLRSSLSFLSASSRQELASVRRISFSTSAVLPSRRACGSWQFVRRAKGLSVVRCQLTPPVFWQCAAIVLEHLGAPTFSKFGRSEEVDSKCIFELYRREENECSTGERLLNSSMTIMTFFVFSLESFACQHPRGMMPRGRSARTVDFAATRLSPGFSKDLRPRSLRRAAPPIYRRPRCEVPDRRSGSPVGLESCDWPIHTTPQVWAVHMASLLSARTSNPGEFTS